ncbi:hypothetical protein KIW84_032093 [Lathyrus oleraceus]|uniref:Ubiquitin-like protease family profile domain-containing protein n=1 Tax=Pisum sativum TaxID=3888 RepID=A0A9D4XS92_PEA|nr:hypothetical protein KIW84_032093 [Pisum sativum]
MSNKFLKDEEGKFVEAERPMKYAEIISAEEWDNFVAKRRNEKFHETLSQTLPSTEVQDCRSVLSRVLNVPEYSGRVRSKGFGVTPSSFYKKPKTKNPTNKEVMETLAELRAQVLELQKENARYREERCGSEAKDTSDRASINCQPKFPEGITPCQLYLSSPTYRIVGKGKVHNTSGELLHHNPLPVGYMKVSVDLVLDTDALLPLPDVVSETTLMRDAVGSFVGWPSDLIFPDAETPTRPTHKAGKGISRRIELVASQKEVPGRKLKKAGKDIPTTSGTKSQIMMRLEKMVEESDIMHGAIRSVDIDEGVFGIAHSEIIAKEDMQQLFEHEELGIAVIHTYIWYMYDTLMRGTELCNRFNFIAASRINTTFITKNPTSVKNELVDRFMAAGDNTTPSLYFLPFNSGNGGHWVLVAMDLSRLMVYYLDSLSGDWSKYPSMKKTIDTAILKFRSKKNYRNRKDITWVRVQCPQQNNSIDCGFFVLRFMRDIIALNRIDIPKMVWNNNLGFILILSDISSNLLLNHEYVLFS